MKLEQLKAEILRRKGLPYLRRLQAKDKGGNYRYCRVCNEYVTRCDCRNNGSMVAPIGTIGDLWPK